MDRAQEIAAKLALVRESLDEKEVLRLRGSDWFAWITAGASNVVLLASATGIAEVLVSREAAKVLTDVIEEKRLRDEELTRDFEIHSTHWADPKEREQFVREFSGAEEVLSDKPRAGEAALPASLLKLRYCLLSAEIERYRVVGKLASEAMTEVMSAAKPAWTEYQLAGAGAEALWSRGLHPALTLAAGEKRLPLYRHPTPRDTQLDKIAMLVFCARGFGLYANLTRFVSFTGMPESVAGLHTTVREIEADALEQSLPGNTLAHVHQTLVRSYRTHAHRQAIHEHHQGGVTGYLAREILATPDTTSELRENMAVAWNPSIAGAKIEDTFLITNDGLENLTFDEKWPHHLVRGIARPFVLQR